MSTSIQFNVGSIVKDAQGNADSVDLLMEEGDRYFVWHVNGTYTHEEDTVSLWREHTGLVLFYNETQGYGGRIVGMMEGWADDEEEGGDDHKHTDGWSTDAVVEYALACVARGTYEYAPTRPRLIPDPVTGDMVSCWS